MKEEVMVPPWKNPMVKVKAPKVILDPSEPISIQDVGALTNTRQRGDFIGERDRAIFLFLLDTGARAQEACNMNIKDADLNTGAVMIRYGKGGKTRMVLSDAQQEKLYALICGCVMTRLLFCSFLKMKNVLLMTV
jgi:site-specific recombinase XerD